jgi:hypothetical protein
MEKRKISYNFPIQHRLGLNIVQGSVTAVDLSSLEAGLLSWKVLLRANIYDA